MDPLQDILDSKKLLTPKEIYERLGISRTTLWRLMEDRRIPYFRISGHPKFDGRQIKNWLAKREVKTA